MVVFHPQYPFCFCLVLHPFPKITNRVRIDILHAAIEIVVLATVSDTPPIL